MTQLKDKERVEDKAREEGWQSGYLQGKGDVDLLKELKKTILKGFGKRCSDFHWACAVCDVWLAFSILEDLFREDEN